MGKTKAKMNGNGSTPYIPSPLIQPTYDDLRNKRDAQYLTRVLQESMSPIEFAQERLVRARCRARQAEQAVADFRKTENLNEPIARRALERLEREAYEASADAIHAEGLFDCACEGC